MAPTLPSSTRSDPSTGTWRWSPPSSRAGGAGLREHQARPACRLADPPKYRPRTPLGGQCSMDDLSRWLTPDEVALRLPVPGGQVRRMIRDGAIPSAWDPGRRSRVVSPADLRLYIERH